MKTEEQSTMQVNSNFTDKTKSLAKLSNILDKIEANDKIEASYLIMSVLLRKFLYTSI